MVQYLGLGLQITYFLNTMAATILLVEIAYLHMTVLFYEQFLETKIQNYRGFGKTVH